MVGGLAENWGKGRTGFGLGKVEDNRLGRSEGRKGMTKGVQWQTIVNGKAGRGGYREREGRRIEHR